MERLKFELNWLEDKGHNDKFNYLLNHENFIFRLTCVEAVQAATGQGDQEFIDRLKALKKDPHPAVAAAARDDAYFFNLACVDCKRDLYDQEADDYDQKEVSVEQFTKWASRGRHSLPGSGSVLSLPWHLRKKLRPGPHESLWCATLFHQIHRQTHNRECRNRRRIRGCLDR